MEKADFRWAAVRFAERMPPTELDLIVYLMGRIELGYDRYGPLEARLDSLPLGEMELEEVADQVAYRAMAGIRARRGARGWLARWLAG